MRKSGVSSLFSAVVLAAILLGVAPNLAVAAPAAPAAAPGGSPNLLYGEVKPGSEDGPVIVFIHGLRGQPSDWTFERAVTPNEMYELAYNAGYRTVFVGLNADNTRNDAGIIANRMVLESLLPEAAAELGVSKMIMVTHSKGATDLQAAMLEQPGVLNLVQEVYTIASPHTGTELADWALGPGLIFAAPLGLLTPGVISLATGPMELLRGVFDLYFRETGIQFYTMAATAPQTNLLMAITGAILDTLTGNEVNDGLVPLSRTGLPIEYGADLGTIETNHFLANLGSFVFPRINAQIQALDNPTIFKSIADDGFGDFENSFAWSLGWYKGKLYVGTGRSFLCVTLATADASGQSPNKLYPPTDTNVNCTPHAADLPVRAEIWQYTPETHAWKRVYQSPEDVPVEVDGQVKLVAHDIAYRGMAVHTEADGTEALYVGGVSGGAYLSIYPPYDGGAHFPSPRILRTTDGENWAPIPMNPGTFLASIGDEPGTIKARGWRSLLSFNGRLFATATDFIGVGRLAYSDTPELGNDTWQWGSAIADDFPIWTLLPYNGSLYMTTGNRFESEGYGVWRTDGTGTGLLNFEPVVTGGAGQAEELRSAYALSLAEFGGALYVGTDRPTELIRVFPDDSWELLVGAPRLTPTGLWGPLSGMTTGFGNFFNGHFWRMSTTESKLFLSTWDWTTQLSQFPGATTFTRPVWGFDLYRTEDGIIWHAETREGFGDPFNYGGRTQLYTPFGIVVGSANPFSARGGAEIFLRPNADFDENGVVDYLDLEVMTNGLGQTATGPKDPRDFDADGEITAFDVRKFVTQCTVPGCIGGDALPDLIEAPGELYSVPGSVTAGQPPLLSWQPSSGAVRYHIYRSKLGALGDVLTPGNQGNTTSGAVGLEELEERFDELCEAFGNAQICALADTPPPLVPGPPIWVGTTTGTTFADNSLPTGVQAIYYVKAEDIDGKLSDFSNLVGGPSLAPAATFASLRNRLEAAVKPGSKRLPEFLAFVDRAERLAVDGRVAESQQELGLLLAAVSEPPAAAEMADMASHSSVQFLARQLPRNLEFLTDGLLPISALTGRSGMHFLTEQHVSSTR